MSLVAKSSDCNQFSTRATNSWICGCADISLGQSWTDPSWLAQCTHDRLIVFHVPGHRPTFSSMCMHHSSGFVSTFRILQRAGAAPC